MNTNKYKSISIINIMATLFEREPVGGAKKDGPVEGKRVYNVYVKTMLHQKIALKITEIGKNVKQNLEKQVVARNEGRCIAQGYIKPNSVAIQSYSCGKVREQKVEFDVIFECLLCHPVKDMMLECKVKDVTLAGIHAIVKDADSDNEPITVFLAKDHHHGNRTFAEIKEDQTIVVRVIGVRYELNDPVITVLAVI
jgi:DNA-directed RNA polymerase subunit E'/Rpb7